MDENNNTPEFDEELDNTIILNDENKRLKLIIIKFF